MSLKHRAFTPIFDEAMWELGKIKFIHETFRPERLLFLHATTLGPRGIIATIPWSVAALSILLVVGIKEMRAREWSKLVRKLMIGFSVVVPLLLTLDRWASGGRWLRRLCG